jgi:hypothetical protein
LEADEVWRLVVGNDAIEIENDRSNHTRPGHLLNLTLPNG